MNRIQQCFERARAEGRAAYVAYLTMGAPSVEASFAAAEQVLAVGADILELGVPFSDPAADGPTAAFITPRTTSLPSSPSGDTISVNAPSERPVFTAVRTGLPPSRR